MEHTMLRDDVMEVRGAASEAAAGAYARRVSGRTVVQVLHIALDLYTVVLA